MKILHLYHDIMNLYGEYGNVLALSRIFEKSGAVCQIDRLSLNDNAVLSDYDFIYIGSGTEKNQKLVLHDFVKYKAQLKTAIDNKKVMLFTGNSFEMLGKTITNCDGKAYDGLNIFDFTVTEQNKRRVTGDVIYSADFLTKPLVGFVNKCSEIEKINSPLFNVKMGLADNGNSKTEGIRVNNLFGTHLTGPALIKNPHFLVYIAELIAKQGEKISLETDYLTYENAGYEITLKELTARMENN